MSAPARAPSPRWRIPAAPRSPRSKGNAACPSSHAAVPAADIHQAALPGLPFPDGSFGATVANFVINHVGDPAAANRELQRVVRSGGRLAVTIWPYPPPPAQQLWTTIFDDAGVEHPADLPRLAPDKDFPRTREGLAHLLHRTGLTGIHCGLITWTHHTDPEAWCSGLANGIGAAGLLMQRQDAATIYRIRKQYDHHTAAYRDAEGRLAVPTAALLASASVRATTVPVSILVR